MTGPLEEAIQRASAGYVYTDTFEEAIDSLEMTARFLEESESDPRRWKWVVIALHLAIQNFMVLVLKNSWDVGTQHRDVRNEKLEAHHNFYRAIVSGDKAAIEEASAKDRAAMGKNKLDGFDWLYERIKDQDHWAMEYLGNDKVFEPGVTCNDSMERLKDLRDDYMHFQSGCRFVCLSSLALIAVDGLSVIEFLIG
jgi:hypothetical protein